MLYMIPIDSIRKNCKDNSSIFWAMGDVLPVMEGKSSALIMTIEIFIKSKAMCAMLQVYLLHQKNRSKHREALPL